MNGNEHINFSLYSVTLLGAGFGVGKLGLNVTVEYAGYFVAGAIIGSLLPDVDHPQSILGRFSPIPWLHKKLKKWFGWHILKHGGITHTVLVNTWIFILAYIYKSMLIAGIGVGYATHLYIDNLDGNKLNMLWWPIIRGRKYDNAKTRANKKRTGYKK